MIIADFLIWMGAIFLFFAVLAAAADLIERRERRQPNDRFRENQRLRRSNERGTQ